MREKGELDAEISNQIQTGWRNWKKASEVLCDKGMNARVKSIKTRVYIYIYIQKTKVRPLYCMGRKVGRQNSRRKRK